MYDLATTQVQAQEMMHDLDDERFIVILSSPRRANALWTSVRVPHDM